MPVAMSPNRVVAPAKKLPPYNMRSYFDNPPSIKPIPKTSPKPPAMSPSKVRTPKLSYQDKIKRGLLPPSMRNKSANQRAEFSLSKLKEMKQRGLGKTTPMIGGLYLYAYSAKTANDLPYWDAFPLMMCVEKYDDGWLGLNFHYLHPVLRAKLMDAIDDIASKTGKNERMKYKISYSLLRGASRAKVFKPCVKRYLTTQMRSKMLELAKSDWDLALALPLARWQKASASQVYSDSRKSV